MRFRYFAEGSFLFGVGRTVDVSSGGVLVVFPHILCQRAISVGDEVEMGIEWPPLLDGRISLQLFAVGCVVRRRPFDFAGSFERYQLRTTRSSSEPLVRLRTDVIERPPSKLTLSLSLDRSCARRDCSMREGTCSSNRSAGVGGAIAR